ncbi:hypothetical protein [Robertmurraya massiliosenegalensis]|uniref:hypothetical protein n=1 Tax=Robertmurraya massiliosenegalensis TaxID=1287657 RepID=UPI000372BE29|nr:hypothetical protein [Robertmurraya massiliosenegalensis]
MIVNHGGNLSKEYFLAYIKLVMNSRNCPIETAKAHTIKLFFKNDKNRYGKSTYQSFENAFHELIMEK